MFKDRRWISWLTQEGVKCLIAERDRVLNEYLPAEREGTPEEVSGRKKEIRFLLKRVLYINRMLHYNGNMATRPKDVYANQPNSRLHA